MHEDLEAATQIGQVLAGKYRIERVLGVGGMGVVVAAMHLQLDQRVALKFLRREALMNADIVGRFEREARAAVRLKSEHVARIIDVGTLETGSPYIVMEHLEGQDLTGLLQQYGTLAVTTACDFVIQACDAMAEAHALGIVHRDLKPGNLFLANTSHGQQIIKVLDFGISKTHGPTADPSMTRTQSVMGSPGYMSPEQMRSTKNVDGRTDVWSLGVILYELVAGKMPFQADTFTALCVKIAMDPHPPLPALPAALPPGFTEVLDRALEKDPARRIPSAIELARALAPFASPAMRDRALRLGTAAVGVQVSGAYQLMMPASSAETTMGSAAAQMSAGAKKTRQLVAVGIGVVIAAMIAIGVVATRGGTRAATPGSERGMTPMPPPAASVPMPPTPAPAPTSAPAPVAPAPAAPTPTPVPAAPAPAAPIPTPATSAPAKPSPTAPARPSKPRKPTTTDDRGIFDSAD